MFPPFVVIEEALSKAIDPPALVAVPVASLSDHKVTSPPLVVMVLLAF